MAAATYYSANQWEGNPNSNYHSTNRMQNQIIIAGDDGQVLEDNAIFCLEQIVVVSGETVEIQDGSGRTIIPEIGDIDCAMSPIRCDNGIKIVGTVLMAKGFLIMDVLS